MPVSIFFDIKYKTLAQGYNSLAAAIPASSDTQIVYLTSVGALIQNPSHVGVASPPMEASIYVNDATQTKFDAGLVDGVLFSNHVSSGSQVGLNQGLSWNKRQPIPKTSNTVVICDVVNPISTSFVLRLQYTGEIISYA